MTQQTINWTDGQGASREKRQRQQRAIKHGGLVKYLVHLTVHYFSLTLLN